MVAWSKSPKSKRCRRCLMNEEVSFMDKDVAFVWDTRTVGMHANWSVLASVVSGAHSTECLVTDHLPKQDEITGPSFRSISIV